MTVVLQNVVCHINRLHNGLYVLLTCLAPFFMNFNNQQNTENKSVFGQQPSPFATQTQGSVFGQQPNTINNGAMNNVTSGTMNNVTSGTMSNVTSGTMNNVTSGMPFTFGTLNQQSGLSNTQMNPQSTSMPFTNQPTTTPFTTTQTNNMSTNMPFTTSSSFTTTSASPFTTLSSGIQASAPQVDTSKNVSSGPVNTESVFNLQQNTGNVAQTTSQHSDAVNDSVQDTSGVNDTANTSTASIPAPTDEQKKTSIFGDNSKLINIEKNTSFVQMTLYEIVQDQLCKLEGNINMFCKKAKEIYDEDEKLLRSLTNYKILDDVLKKEEIRLAELEENIEFFDKLLDDYNKNIVSTDEDDEFVTCVKEFEKVTDDFYRKMEENGDKEDEVLGLLQVNMRLCNVIDSKLDMYESYK